MKYCAKPTKQDLTLFFPCNNYNYNNHPNLAAPDIGEGPYCDYYFVFMAIPKTNKARMMKFCKNAYRFKLNKLRFKFSVTLYIQTQQNLHSNTQRNSIIQSKSTLKIKQIVIKRNEIQASLSHIYQLRQQLYMWSCRSVCLSVCLSVGPSARSLNLY